MKQLYDEYDANNNLVATNILLIPGLKLPEGHRWEVHLPSIEELKSEKRSYIENNKLNTRLQPVSALGYTWQADTLSQTLLTSAILLAQIGAAPVPPTWRTLDNIDVSVSLDDLKTIAGAMAAQTQYAYSTSWNLKARVDAATTAEELASIVWS